MSDDLFELGERIADLAAEEVRHRSRTFSVAGDADGMYGVRVSAETSLRVACDAARVAMCHRDGEVVSVGRRRRTIPPHIRRALEERDRGCRYPGCASRFTEAHHVKHWADGGETSLANTVLLCRRHHRLVHEGGTRLALDRDGKARSSRATVRCSGARPRCRRSPGSCRSPRPRPPT
ncbi:MAG: HNH endonuclease signature motif containing protein, partial [Gemmatimonadota bacterium]|nr:HNH endonuclease signature motif containing protein [Gemmatimonadota bacterium]